MWYKFEQSNSGGQFFVDEKVCHFLYIEAGSLDEANKKAIDLGVYFDGCEKGRDCPCCGDRWGEGYLLEFPFVWNRQTTFQNVEEMVKHIAKQHNDPDEITRMFYADGSIKEIIGKGI